MIVMELPPRIPRLYGPLLSNTEVCFGSEAAAGKRILSVCFGEFNADGYC